LRPCRLCVSLNANTIREWFESHYFVVIDAESFGWACEINMLVCYTHQSRISVNVLRCLNPLSFERSPSDNTTPWRSEYLHLENHQHIEFLSFLRSNQRPERSELFFQFFCKLKGEVSIKMYSFW